MKTPSTTLDLAIGKHLSPVLSALVGAGIVLALGSILQPWVMAVWLAALGLGVAAREAVLEHDGFRRGAFLLVLMLAVALYWRGPWLPLLAQVLLLLLAAKHLELRSQRDVYQIAILALLGLGLAAFVRMDLLLGLVMAWILVCILILLLWQPLADAARKHPEMRLQWRWGSYVGALGLVFALCLLPLALLLFFILPRAQFPLLQWSPASATASIGFSPDLRLGGVARLAATDGVAFRARIHPFPPDPDNLYWTGAVLWHNVGDEWRPDPPLADAGYIWPDNGLQGRSVHQSITLPPNKTPYLFALPQPLAVSGLKAVRFNPDGSLRLPQAPAFPLRYEVVSAPPGPTLLSGRERRAALQLAAGLDPRLFMLARGFRRAGDSPERTSGRIIDWLSGPAFHYSIEPVPGYPRGQSLAQFLFESRTGYCEYFASALATLLRIDGIPARVAVGFRGGEYNPMGNYWVIPQKFAHAWVEAWYPARGWVLLDPTPGSPVNPFPSGPAAVRAQAAAAAPALVPPRQRIWDWLQWRWNNLIVNFSLDRQANLWRGAGNAVAHALAQATRWRIGAPQLSLTSPVPLGRAFIPVLLMALLVAAVVAWLWWRRRRNPAYWRRRAAQRLGKAMAGQGILLQRGREEQLWAWWRRHHGEICEEVYALYHAQRYGSAPDEARDRRLAHALAGMGPPAAKRSSRPL